MKDSKNIKDIPIGSNVFVLVMHKTYQSAGCIRFELAGKRDVPDDEIVESSGIFMAKVIGIQHTNRLALLVKTGKTMDEWVYVIQDIPGHPGVLVGVNREDIYPTLEEAQEELERKERGANE